MCAPTSTYTRDFLCTSQWYSQDFIQCCSTAEQPLIYNALQEVQSQAESTKTIWAPPINHKPNSPARQQQIPKLIIACYSLIWPILCDRDPSANPKSITVLQINQSESNSWTNSHGVYNQTKPRRPPRRSLQSHHAPQLHLRNLHHRRCFRWWTGINLIIFV